VLLNAAAALIVAEEADSFEAGLKIAAEVIDSGKARAKLHQLAEMSQNLA
jgi:anthranilate phosphoribosyltransferase